MFCIILHSFLQDVVFQWLTTDNIHLNQIDAEDPEVRDNVSFLPDEHLKIGFTRTAVYSLLYFIGCIYTDQL